MDSMGWSTTAMAKRYQHVIDPIRTDVAERVDGLIWGGGEDQADTPKQPPGEGN